MASNSKHKFNVLYIEITLEILNRLTKGKSGDDEADEDEVNSNKSSKGPSNAGAFSALETAMEWYEQQSECCPTQLLLLKRIRGLYAKTRSVRFHILRGSQSVFGYPNNRVSQRCPVPIDSDKRRSILI
ncbi:uncharacterized protein TNCV_3098461 [Trichonephila clavipes]|nr:uncharacterized protein TNCV_3098461 [Trichonephila clavipes]